MKIGAKPETAIEWLITLLGLAPTPIIDTFHAMVISRAIIVATKLCVFDALSATPLSSEDAADRLGLSAPALEKLLNVLVSMGYLRFRMGQYGLTRVSRKWLLAGGAESLRDNMLLRFLEWQAIERTEDFVRTGSALDVHELLRPDQWNIYQRGMRSLARFSAAEVARRVPLPAGAEKMLDIGGGHGTYAVAFCRRHAKLRATILDLPEAVQTSAPILAEEQMGERVAHRAGNALTEDLGNNQWDFILLCHLVHHFDESSNQDLVHRAAAALRPGGVLAILDVLRPADPSASSQTGALLDLYFGLTSNSGTWSRDEISSWCTGAGLLPGRPIALRAAPGITILTARNPRS